MPVPIRAVTRGPGAHFFGYYDKSPWDRSGRYLLGLETGLSTQPPGAADTAVIGLIDTAQDCAWRPLAETQAWNWQMGSRLHWLPPAADRKIIYNIRQGARFAAEIRDVFTGETTRLVHPVYDVTADGRTAYTLNFARLAVYRPGYGYAGVSDPAAADPHPTDDGIWRVDLATGKADLIVSYAFMAAFHPVPSMEGVAHWFNHILVNPSGTRLFFYHRWRWIDRGVKYWHTRLITINPDGSEPFVIPGFEQVSHYDWRDDTHILLTARPPGGGDHSHTLVEDRCAGHRILGRDVLRGNGHCSYSPDRRWILTDTYPDTAQESALILFRLKDETRIDLGRFLCPPAFSGEVRCDLHPRWSRDGRFVCFDSAHLGDRQMFVADVSRVVSDAAY
jgi:hypothetical protein